MINRTFIYNRSIENQTSQKNSDKTSNLEILCPFTKKVLKSSQCYQCNFCHIYEGSHKSGRNLTSLICMYEKKLGNEE